MSPAPAALCVVNVIGGIIALLIANYHYKEGNFWGGVLCDITGVVNIGIGTWGLHG